MAFCGFCGAQVQGMRFCGSCGRAVAATQQPADPLPTAAVPASAAGPLFVGHRPPPITDPGPTLEPAVRKRSRRGVWIAVAIVAVVVVAGSASAYFLFSAKKGGAESPEAAVTQLATALQQRDLVGAALLLPPGEFQAAQGAFTALGDAAVRANLAAGSTDLPSVLSGANLSFDGLKVASRPISADLAKVEITDGTMSVAINPAGATGLTREILQSATVDWAKQGRFTVDSNVIARFLGYRPFVMAVQRDGGWYVSPLFTAGEYLSLQRDTARAPVTAGDGTVEQYPTPEAAADAFVRKLADAINQRDSSILASGLPPDEAEAVLTYRRALDSALSNTALTVGILDTSFTAEGDNPALRIVRPDLISLQASTRYNSVRIDIQGGCVVVDNGPQECLSDLTNQNRELAPLLTNLDTGLVAVKSGDGWRISPLTTVLTQATRLVQGWTPSAMLLTVATISRSESAERALFTTPSVGTFDANGSVKIEFNGQAYAVVDFPVATVDQLRGHVSATDGDCEVAWTMSPSGAIKKYDSPDETGTYRLIVMPTADTVDNSSHCTLQFSP